MLGKDYFLKVYNEENVEQAEGTPVVEVKVDEPVVEEKPVVPEIPPVEKPIETPTPVDTPKKDVITIDGEEISLDVIKEWKQGNMRQSDYTRKTQELAKQKKELEELKSKKEVDDTEVLTEKSPELQRIEKIEFDLASKQLDFEITTLKQKYPDFDEVKVLNECEKRNIYNDLEFVYKALRDADVQTPSTIDVEKLKQQAIDEYKNTIALELAKNKEATSGSIISSAPGQPPTDFADALTSEEKDFCRKRGWTAEYYAKMKDTQYKI